MPGGRPTKFNPKQLAQIKKALEAGFTDIDLAILLNVTEKTINNWKSANEEFLQSLNAGKKVADDKVEASLFHRANGYSHDAVKIFNDDGKPLIVPYTERFPPDPTSCIFWLKNRRANEWRDKQEVDHNIQYVPQLLEK